MILILSLIFCYKLLVSYPMKLLFDIYDIFDDPNPELDANEDVLLA